MYVHYRAANVLCQGSAHEFAFYRGQIHHLAARDRMQQKNPPPRTGRKVPSAIPPEFGAARQPRGTLILRHNGGVPGLLRGTIVPLRGQLTGGRVAGRWIGRLPVPGRVSLVIRIPSRSSCSTLCR